MRNPLISKPASVAVLSFLLFAPWSVMAESEGNTASESSESNTGETNSSGGCIDVITYGQNPETGEWQTFPTPCEVPVGWVTSTTQPPPQCPKEIIYGQNPETKNWYTFSTPCDVPKGWLSSSTQPVSNCIEVITYAQNPDTTHWYAFSNFCDIPTGWVSSPTPFAPEFSEVVCPDSSATYSSDGKLYIPSVIYKTPEGTTLSYEGVELKRLPEIIDPFVFVLTHVPVPK
ncbi:MAG: hypothetical protein BWK78_00730 [Thiotrichaceae bacterium IS1]|nr:MAG: hypothetical protein BWK78_00730 [Thiotrichaceae bacterium IS1]